MKSGETMKKRMDPVGAVEDLKEINDMRSQEKNQL